MSGIQVVDFSPLSIQLPDSQLVNEDAANTAKNVFTSFETVGFVYLKNTGIDFSLVRQAHEAAKQFFDLPENIKCRSTISDISGYVKMGLENLDSSTKGDLKESYNVTAEVYLGKQYPTELPIFGDIADKFFRSCLSLSERIYRVIAIGLQLQDSEFFIQHLNIGKKENRTTLRFLCYPALHSEFSDGEKRLGEHTDYGSFTLLFQESSATPLQVRTLDGSWIEAKPVEDTVLVNIADLMQHWTADRLKSTPHMLPAPVDKISRQKPRYSIVFFVNPDSDTRIECLDGSDKYPSITAGEYLDNKHNMAYRY